MAERGAGPREHRRLDDLRRHVGNGDRRRRGPGHDRDQGDEGPRLPDRLLGRRHRGLGDPGPHHSPFAALRHLRNARRRVDRAAVPRGGDPGNRHGRVHDGDRQLVRAPAQLRARRGVLVVGARPDLGRRVPGDDDPGHPARRHDRRRVHAHRRRDRRLGVRAVPGAGLVSHAQLEDARQDHHGHDRDHGDGAAHRRRRVDLRLAADGHARHRRGRRGGAVLHPHTLGVPAARELPHAVPRLLSRAGRGDHPARAHPRADLPEARNRPRALRTGDGAEPDDRPAAPAARDGAVRPVAHREAVGRAHYNGDPPLARAALRRAHRVHLRTRDRAVAAEALRRDERGGRQPVQVAAGMRDRAAKALLIALLVAGSAQAAFTPPDVIVVVSDDSYPPYLFRTESGHLEGIIADKWSLWSRTTGVRVSVVGLEWVKAQETVQDGTADVIDALAYRDARAALYEFSPSYADVDARVYFHKSITGINTFASMRGFIIGAKDGSACGSWLAERGITTLRFYPTSDAVVEAARTRQVPLFCMDEPAAQYFIVKQNLAGEFHQTEPLYTARFHWAVAKGHAELRDFIQKGFDRISARELKDIDTRWIGTPVGSPFDMRYLYYAAAFGLGLVATAAMLIAWNRSLSRRVSARTAELRTALDSMEHQMEALKESEERFGQMFRLSPDGIVVTTATDGRVIEANDAMLRILDRQRNDVIGRTVTDLGIWRDMFEHKAKVAVPAMTPGGIRQYEHAVRTPQGEKRDLLARTTRIDLQGEAVLLSMVRDITQRRRAQRLLEESEKRLAKMIEGSPEAITIASIEDGTFMLVNPAAQRLSGYTAGEMIGQSAIALGFWPDTEERKRLVADVQRYEAVHAREIRLRRKDGLVRNVLASAALIDFEGGKFMMFQGIDITARKEAEKKLQEHQELLRELSAHHETVREEERAHIAREIHDEMGQALTALKMDMSVIGLASAKSAPKTAKEIQGLKGRVDDIIQLVRDVAAALRPSALDLGILSGIEWLVDEFQKRSGIRCEVRVEDGEIHLKEDRSIVLFRILQESLTNISRHANARNVEIRLRSNATHIRLDVKDDGRGFDAEAAQKKKTFGLLGIRERVIMLHGTMNITSVPGEGTQVSVSIPL